MISRVESYLTALTTASKLPGIQYVVVNAADVLFEYAGGWADIRRKGARRCSDDDHGVLDEQDNHRGGRSATRRDRESRARRFR